TGRSAVCLWPTLGGHTLRPSPASTGSASIASSTPSCWASSPTTPTCWSSSRAAEKLQMKALIVVNNPKDWPFQIPGVEVVDARSYLTQPAYSELRGSKVFNLCRSYRYQALGYYVSLLATARGHKPVPTVGTIQDLKASEIVRIRSDELDALIQKSLAAIVSKTFVLSIYFGRNLARRYDKLSAHLFKLFHAPLLRAAFTRSRSGRWHLQSVLPISADDIPKNHRPFVLEVA